MGIFFAVTALFAWGLGDFLIQRSARKFGDWLALFYVTAFAAIVLFPFVYQDIAQAFATHGPLLLLVSVVIFIAALWDFEALKEGKISVVEPIYAMEIPITALLALVVIREALTPLQMLLIVVSVFGIFLISTRSFGHFKHVRLERGIWYAILATIGMGFSNFLFGFSAREVDPLMVVWTTSIFMASACFVYLIVTGRAREIVPDFRHHKRLIVNMGFFDAVAWVSFSYACLTLPIAIATSISEAYIVLAAGLGLVFNKERLKLHQYLGFVVAVVSLILLAYITDM